VKSALLDTNVLLALAWPNHQHHAPAHGWFAATAKKGWATCAFTQLGFIRLSANPAYTANAVSPQEAAALLQQWTRLKTHRFWNSPAADGRAILPPLSNGSRSSPKVNCAPVPSMNSKASRNTNHRSSRSDFDD
jgi:toxin-antitoxin system PIN domain toxin